MNGGCSPSSLGALPGPIVAQRTTDGHLVNPDLVDVSEAVSCLPEPNWDMVQGTAWAPDGTQLYVATPDGIARLAENAATGRFVVAEFLETGADGVPATHPYPTERAMAVSADGRFLLVASEQHSSISVFATDVCAESSR